MHPWFKLDPWPPDEWLEVAGQRVPLVVVAHARARRYVLRLRSDGTARVTVPRGGSVAEAHRFARRNLAWLEKQLQRPAVVIPPPAVWGLGSEVLFRGERVKLEVGPRGGTAIELRKVHRFRIRWCEHVCSNWRSEPGKTLVAGPFASDAH